MQNPFLLLSIGMVLVLGGILILRLHPVIALLIGALVVGGLTSSESLEIYAGANGYTAEATKNLISQSTGARVALAFGNTCGKIGILIALASIIGKCLLETGAAEKITRSAVKLSGQKYAPLSFMGSSFLVSTPVFFDTVFYLMVPLARAMGVKSRKSYSLYIMAICAGGVMAHSLVPPTPGPLFVASELGVNIGMMILMGIIVGLICASVGLVYATWLNKRRPVPLRDTIDTSVEDLERGSEKDTSELPPLFLSLLPIALPVILIAGNTTLSIAKIELSPAMRSFFSSIGDPTIALFLATFISLGLLLKQYGYKLKAIQKPVQDALYSAGTIVLITSSGGAFGGMLQQTAIGPWLADIAPGYKLAALPLAFAVTAIIRTAQGSATVAMITTVGILAAFMASNHLDFHPVYIAIAIGCGSKPFPWMNDSGFWIICKMSGFTERETIANFSVLLTIMGIVGLITCMILAKLFPLI
jgi:gluconate:H+ symporter, GntP family